MDYAFGSFVLRKQRRELWKNGKQVSVQPKALDLLIFLIERSDQVVSKDEILETVWPGVHISETALTRCVMKARRAVGDDADQQTVIKTVHGHGYRFIADVTEASDAALQENSRQATGSIFGKRARVFALPGAALLAIMIWIGIVQYSASSDAGDIRVAVLPIQNTTGLDELDWTEIGLMSLVDNYLSVEANLKTVPSADILRYVSNLDRYGGNTPSDNRVIVRRLLQSEGATHVILADFISETSGYRIEYLIERSDGSQRQPAVFGDSPMELGRQLAGSVATSLLTPDANRIVVDQVISEDLFVEEAFARGRALQLQGQDSSAAKLFEAGLQQEPDNYWLEFYSAIGKRNAGEYEDARTHFLRILNETDSLQHPDRANSIHAALGFLYYRQGDVENAGRHYDQALEFANATGDRRRVAHALTSLGTMEDYVGNFEAARGYYQQALNEYLAINVSPPPARLLSAFAILEAGEGNYDAASDYFERSIKRFDAVGDLRGVVRQLGNLAFLHYTRGDWDRADTYFEETLNSSQQLEDPHTAVFGVIRWSKLKIEQGQFEQAEALNEDAQRILDEHENPRMLSFLLKNVGALHLARGEYDQALITLERKLQLDESMNSQSSIRTSLVSIARAKYHLGDITEARDMAEQIIDSPETIGKPQYTEALELIANIRFDAGESVEGEALLERAYQASVDRQDGLSIARLSARLGEIALDRDDLDKADRYLMEGQSVHADLPYVLKLAAKIAGARGDQTAAVELMTKAKKRSGGHWTAEDEHILLELSARLPTR